MAGVTVEILEAVRRKEERKRLAEQEVSVRIFYYKFLC
jgi:hypothetical protein